MKTISPLIETAPETTPENTVQQHIDRLRDIYHKNIAKTPVPRTVLGTYGLTDQNLIERYLVGYSDGGLPQLLALDPTLRAQLKRLGVLDGDGKERFADCLTFPIDSADGRRVNLWACPREGPSRFLLGRPVALWNAIAAKHSAHLYVFATPLEALTAAAAGLPNIVALDAESGQPDIPAISGWGVQRLTVVVPDTADGASLGEKLRRRLEPLNSTVVKIPRCTTINEFFRLHSAQALSDAIVAATHGLQAITIPGMEPRADGFDHTIGGRCYRIRGLMSGPQKLTAVISREQGGKIHLDKVDLLSARSRKEFAREIVRIFHEQADLIEADIGKLLAACEQRAAQATTPVVPKPGTIPEADRKEGEAFGRDPKLIEHICADYERHGLVGERANKLLSYLTMTSRKLKQPLALLTVAMSGAGKSALQEVTTLFCPPDEIEKITMLSGKALFHKEHDSLRGKLVAFEEAEGAAKADYPLRVMISAGELTTEVAVKDGVTGKLTTVRNTVKGPIAVLLTTTALSMNPETISRFFVTSIDDGREQTRAIQARQRREQTLEGLAQELGRPDIVRRHHAFQRLLQPVRVVNPLVDKVEFDDDRVSARREFPKRLRLIQAIALLRQMQKPVKHLGNTAYVEVDETDLQIARELMCDLFTVGFSELSPMALGLLRQLVAMRAAVGVTKSTAPDAPFVFTCREARDYTGAPNSSLQRHLKELCAFEFVVREFGRQGQTCRYRLDWDEPGLPTTLPAVAHAQSTHATR